MENNLDINWQLAWTIACGVVLGGFAYSFLSLLSRMWEYDWKITLLLVLCHTIFPATIVGTIMGYLGWAWLVPGLIAGGGCYFVATNILAKQSDA